jgi:hypothetical protein
LALAILSSTSKPLHILFDAHHHESLHVCDQGDDIRDGKAHLHDAHYLTENCDVCNYVLNADVLPEWAFHLDVLRAEDVFSVLILVAEPRSSRTISANGQRGPPCLA